MILLPPLLGILITGQSPSFAYAFFAEPFTVYVVGGILIYLEMGPDPSSIGLQAMVPGEQIALCDVIK